MNIVIYKVTHMIIDLAVQVAKKNHSKLYRYVTAP